MMSTAPASASIVTGVDFVTIPAQDLGDSVRFYGTVLGLPFVKRWGEMPAAEFQAGNLTIAVMDPTAFGQEFRPHAVPVAFARWNSLFELRPSSEGASSPTSPTSPLSGRQAPSLPL
jgi:catechol 2,3-dioxygenase-like lactoylglutathione lyase family enzyme